MLITLKRSGEAGLRFEGEQLAEVCSSPALGHPEFSGFMGHYQEVAIYITAKNKYIVSNVVYSDWNSEADCYEAIVCETTDEAFARVHDFGISDNLRELLYLSANLEYVELVS